MKRLYKSRENKVIAGVCGGIAEYLNVDPVLIRLIAVLFFFTGGAALIAYIIGMIIMPNQPWEASSDGVAAKTESATPPVQTENLGPAGSLIIGVILVVFGVHFLLRRVPFFNTYYWWFWNRSWDFFWPAILIAVGLFIIFKAARK